MSSEGGAIEREVFIAAPPETIFEFLIDAELMARWIGSFQKLDPRPGGIFQVEVSPGNIARGEYVEVTPYRRVAFTWGSLVEIELQPESGGTLLRLRHSRLPDGLTAIHRQRWSLYLGQLELFIRNCARGGNRPQRQ
jgi:uncharacterized protein YndB with AHSA1/START domain